MICVEELLQLSAFRNFTLLAGSAGLKRSVSDVVILEYESERGNYEVFNEGDFVLTSLFFADGHPEKIAPAIRNLIRRGVSGIAIKSVYYREAPPEVKTLMDQAGVPIFTFSNTYMEDIIIAVNDYIRSRNQYALFEKKVQELLNTLLPERVLEIAREIDPHFLPYVTSLYLDPLDNNKESQILRSLNRLNYRRSRLESARNSLFIKFGQGVLLLNQYAEKPAESARKSIRRLLADLEIDSSAYRIGLCDAIYPLEQLDLCIRRSLYACRGAKLQHRALLSYNDLGMYRLLFPLENSHSARTCYEAMLEQIVSYDASYHTKLMQTAESYVEHGGDIAAVSKSLFQHPNTVRYRLQKIKTILDSPDDYEFQVILYLLIRLKGLH
ncbi:PucR family transcriptional regulator [Ethanoligenens harbinense]|uniref:Transcriptional regulator, CdaR n=1 Tax=Ethanoligenens harbinense (strain DSM 18485 / JCM 12961 / CGMCC 1.5033 / YUAN-3) TaxID=663278 RepID=E6U4F4_ETHHY|nr:PucR family transcriptional regulator [Ethanoligenens harbinense]ADU27761.1 transcriptional regulator, CdaR [Ethanoligenens harbinense YUAN-3]AVQ96785.1 PucR family transcriptional regulator [Ethanoligenens harbinense YUAN-3]AYF39447.1 PucR family transcriptional regulator [Ethanoligenens harbinense]AYF42271.1 PucR family transcriptional regulator [Ethanoligenens harbinense]